MPDWLLEVCKTIALVGQPFFLAYFILYNTYTLSLIGLSFGRVRRRVAGHFVEDLDPDRIADERVDELHAPQRGPGVRGLPFARLPAVHRVQNRAVIPDSPALSGVHHRHRPQ